VGGITQGLVSSSSLDPQPELWRAAVPVDGARRRPHKKRPAAATTTGPTAESTCGPITQ